MHPNPQSPSAPEIHVHFEGLGSALQFGGSVLGNHDSVTSNTSSSSQLDSPPHSKSWLVFIIYFLMVSADKCGENPLETPACPSPFAGDSPACFSSQSASLRDALDSLHKVHPKLDFPSMLAPLQDAGMLTLTDLIACGASSVVQWTGLPKTSVVELCAYARRRQALNLVNSRLSPGAETDHSNDSLEDEGYDEKSE